jgi:hypothetical protein
MGPKMPKEMATPSITAYDPKLFAEDVKSYRALVAQGNFSAARDLRNQMAYHVMADLESSYGIFEMRLSTQRAGFQTGSDAIQLGMTAATTLVGASDVKDILAASLSGFQGTRLSLDKNFFQEKTTESLLSQMRASRKTKQAQLITSLGTRDVTSYPWDAAWMDLIELYYAGTIPSALAEISTTAGARADAATDKLNKAVAELTPRTPEQAQQAIDIRAAYEKLSTAATGTDPTATASAVQSLKQILNSAGYQPDDNASAQNLLEMLRKAMGAARSDDKKLESLKAAIAAANLNY